MAKRLNRLLAAIAAAATLATGVAGSAWADTADGKVDFDVKAADGTTLDGMDVGLYKVGDWNMDALERGSDGALTGIHATSADTDDRSGFTVAQDGSQSAVEPHGRAAKAAESAGIAVSDGTDPLDAAWALDPSDSRVKAFAQAYARELSDAGIAASATAKEAGSIRLDPGVYVAVCGSDSATATLAGTATADGSVVKDRGDMGSVTLTGMAVRSKETSEPNLWDKVKGAVTGLLGADAADDSDDEVPKLAGKLTVAEVRDTDASDTTTRIWRIGDLGDSSNAIIKGLENGALTEKAAVKRLAYLTESTPVASIKGTGLVKTGAGWFLTDSGGVRHVTAVGSGMTGNSLYDGEVFVEGKALGKAKASGNKGGISPFSSKMRSARAAVDTISVDGQVVNGHPVPTIPVKGASIGTNRFVWHSDQGGREAFCLQPQAYAPLSGTGVRVALQVNDPGVWRAFLFYGVGGPGDWFARNGVSADDGRAIMHIQTAYMRALQTGDPLTNYTGNVFLYPKGAAWLDFINSHHIDSGYATGNDGNRWFIDTFELTPTGSQSGAQILVSSKVHRAYDLDMSTAVEADVPDTRETDQFSVHDVVKVTAKNGDWPNNEKIHFTTQLVYDPTPDGINPDGTAQADNKSDRKIVEREVDWWLSNGLPNGHTETFYSPWIKPSDMFGEGNGWQYGRYWFYVKVTRGPGNTHMNKDMYEHFGYADGAEGFNRTYVTGRTAAKVKVGGSWADLSDASTLKNLDGSNAPIRDYVNLSGTYPRYKADSNNGGKRQTFTVKQTLHHRDASGKTTDSAAKTFKYAYDEKTPTFAEQNGPEFTPSDLGMKDGWDSGDYWFDNVIEGHLTENSPLNPGVAGYEKNPEKPSETSVVKTWHSHGQTEENEHWTITPTASPTISTRAMAGDARVGGTQKVHDSITVTNHDPNRAITIAKVTTTLHMRTGNRKASKTAGPVTIPAGGSKTFDSANFTPADLGRKCWSNGRYWFDANISATDATYPSGAKALTADLVHDGRNDTNQVFSMTMNSLNDFSTQAQSTFSTAGGTSATHDRLLLATDPDSLANDLSVKVTLNWNASATGTTATKTTTKTDVFTAGFAYKDLKAFTPSDLGMANGWLAGRYWYVVTIPAQDGVDDTIVLDGLKKDTAKESWIVAEPTARLTTKTDAPATLTDLSATAVHDTVTGKTAGYPAGSTFDATLTLNYRAPDGTVSKSKAIAFKAAVNGSTKSPDIAPSAFAGWTKWHIGHYWFDLTAVDPNGKNITVPGAGDANEQFDVANHTTKATLAITTQAAKGTASTVNADPVHDTIRLAATGATLNVARVHVRLNYPKADGTTASAVKDTGAVKVPANGTASIASPTFTPSDLGLGDLWLDNTAGTYYWFDVWVDKADVALSGDTGVMALSGTLSHDGKADAAERFRFDRQTGKATTTAAGTFGRAGGMAATHDTLHLAFPGAKTLKATSTLHYAADAAAIKADASKAKAVTVAANGDVAGPSFAPSDFGWSAWKAGRYWYDLDIPAQAGYNALRVDGLTDKAEQWTAVVPYTLDLAKLAYIGQPGQGRWSNEPVKGATFTLTETTDSTGSTAKPGTSPKTVTTDANGFTHLLDGTIGATGIRWYRLVETAAPASYAKPGKDTYWMIKATGTPTGATISVTGSNEEAKALLKGLDGSAVTIGNRLEGNIMPPMTGGRYDVARAGALAGMVTLGLLIAGCVVLRRRNTSPLDR